MRVNRNLYLMLSARILTNVGSVNLFDYAENLSVSQGDTFDLYFQVINLDQDKSIKGFVPGGRRYVSATGATLQASLENLDDAASLTRVCVQPFPGDLSIWKMSILSSDHLRGTTGLSFTLTEGSKISKGRIDAAVLVSGGSCNCGC